MKDIYRATRRLYIRPMLKTDYNIWKKSCIGRYPLQNSWDYRFPSEAAVIRKKFIAMLKFDKVSSSEDSGYTFAVFRKKDDALIGFISFLDIKRGCFQSSSIGYRLFNQYWGFGYALEMVKKGLSIGFEDLRFHRLEAHIETGNMRSIKLIEQLGFEKEGVRRSCFLRDKEWFDLSLYALIV